MRPLTIRLDQDVKYLSANHSYDLKCEVTGSRPAPLISWWKGSSQLRTTKEWVSHCCVFFPSHSIIRTNGGRHEQMKML